MSSNANSAIASGSLRTTLEIDRLFVQQIYIRSANNIPVSTGFVLQADGRGGTFFGPAAIQADYFALSSMISAGTAETNYNLSTSFQNSITLINTLYSFQNSEINSTFTGLQNTQGLIEQNILNLSNQIINISSYSSFVINANQNFSTLSSYILNIQANFVTNTQLNSSNSTITAGIASTQTFFVSNYSTLTGQTNTTFNRYSTFQQLLYVNNFSTISSKFRTLLSSSSANYSTLSTIVNSQQTLYNQALSTGMSSYMKDFSTILGNEVNLLSTYQYSLTNSVLNLSSLFFSIATYSLSSQITLLTSSLSTAILINISTLNNKLSTIENTYSSLSNTLINTANISNSLNALSTSLIVNYSSLSIELSITQTRGINSQLNTQFVQLGITQSSILANNNSSIRYLSTVIGNNFSSIGYQYSTITIANYSTLQSIGFSSIAIANTQVNNSTIILLNSTFNAVQTSLYRSLSTFSTSLYAFVNSTSNSLYTSNVIANNAVSNWTIQTVSNSINTNFVTVSNNLNVSNQQINNPVLTSICNSLLGVISTTFSTFSSITKSFANLSSANVFTNNLTFNAPLIANQGVFTQFFQICNVISTYIYTYNGDVQTYRPNIFANQILVQLWGAGGGAGTNTNGGGGSYVEGTFSVDSSKIYNISVGGGGAFSTIKYQPYNGGGKNIASVTGSGGGATNIYLGSIINAQTEAACNVAIAGGGGGGGYLSTFTDWNAYEISTATIIRYELNTSVQSNQFLGFSTFSSVLAFNNSSFSTNVINFSSFSSFSFTISSLSTLNYNYSTLSTATIASPSFPPNTYNFSTFSTFIPNRSTFSTLSFNLSSFSTLLFNLSSLSTVFLNSTLTAFVNSTIFLPVGSWGGAGGITAGSNGISPLSTILTNDFSLGGLGATQRILPQPTFSNVITRFSTTPPIFSTIVTQSTFTNYVSDFIPELFGYSPYTQNSLSTNLIIVSNNPSNYQIISTNITQDITFSNYYSTVQNGVPNNSSTLALYYTVRDLYALRNAFSLTALPATAKDYTTDKTPTAIYSADLSFTINPIGSPFGFDVHLMSFPFDTPDPVLYSSSKIYISSVISTILRTSSITNPTGLQYFNRSGSSINYNGTYVTTGIYSNVLPRYVFQNISTLVKYDNRIVTPSTLTLGPNDYSTTSWLLSSTTDSANYTINTNQIVSSIYRQINAGCNYINIPPTFAPYVYDAFLPIAAKSTLNSLISSGSFVMNYSSFNNYVTQYFETSTVVKANRFMYNIFISTAGPLGTTLIPSLPITISSLTRNVVQSTATSFTTNNLTTYISNFFNEQDFTNQGFTVNDISFVITTIADFPTVKLYIQTISTIQYSAFVSPTPVITCNTVYYGDMGSQLQGANASNTTASGDVGIGGGGGGSGLVGGAAGAYTTLLNKYFIGGGGGGGGSSYLNLLTGTGKSVPGNSIYSGFASHPIAAALNVGTGGYNSNSVNNYLFNSTYTSNITSDSVKAGGNGLVVITEFVDPFRITVSTATQTYVPFRIDAQTNEVVVNKLVISSPQLITLGPTNPSTVYLDFANYQQFYITLKDHIVSSFHLIPLSTISSQTMNFQTGSIYLNISTFSTSGVLVFSSFIIENTWIGNRPGVVSSYTNNNTFLFEYSIFNSNAYLTTARRW